MIRLAVDRPSDDELVWRTFADGLMKETRKNAPRAVRAGRRVVVEEMKRLLQLRSGGPAPPGQPPARVEGDLIRSFNLPAVKWERYKGARMGDKLCVAAIVVDDRGAKALEHGRRAADGTEVAPRPFVAPAIANTSDAVSRAMEAEL